VDYVGTNFSGEGAVAPPCTYAVALVDEAAGTISFVPVAGGRVLRLDAQVRGMDYGPPPWTADAAADTAAGRAAARRRLDECAWHAAVVFRVCTLRPRLTLRPRSVFHGQAQAAAGAAADVAHGGAGGTAVQCVSRYGYVAACLLIGSYARRYPFRFPQCPSWTS
jgi:hypothetical protein